MALGVAGTSRLCAFRLFRTRALVLMNKGSFLYFTQFLDLALFSTEAVGFEQGTVLIVLQAIG